MGVFIRKVGDVNVGASVNMEPQATMRWREMRLVNRGTEMEVRTVTRRRDAFFKRRRQQQEQEEHSRRVWHLLHQHF